MILQFFFLSLLLARARGIRDNTRNYTDSALRVCNGLNVVPVGCLTLMPPILGRERGLSKREMRWANVHTWKRN